jgi:elongation factor G
MTIDNGASQGMSNMPPPVLEIAVEPKTSGDREKMMEALARIADDDPFLRVSVDNESRQTIIGGTDEPHLEVILDRLKREFKVDVSIGAPQVAYRETITRPTDIDWTHKKQIGGSGEYARIKMHFEPLARAGGFEFQDAVVGGTVPKEYVLDVEKGVRRALESGVLAGFPVIGLKVTLIDGAYHETDSSAHAFETAARAAVKEGLAKAAPNLLEPVMRVEVVTAREYMGDVIGDFNNRRGHIRDLGQRSDAEVIIATVPLVNMFGYARFLKSLSGGEASFTMRFDHYEPIPPSDNDPFRPAVGMRL